MKRKIVEINEEKCNGCGLCAKACHEGAIKMINGKAKLISDEYCDGLGDCLPACPVDAIRIIEREALEYNEELVKEKMEQAKKAQGNLACGCPGTAERKIERKPMTAVKKVETSEGEAAEALSELRQWPVQLKLVNTKAGFWDNADVLVAADCTAYAYAGFHKDFIKDRITVIGCPKLDDAKFYEEKLADILKNNNIRSLTVVRMEVPCCGGIVSAVKNAMLSAQVIVPYKEITISTDGRVI
ncbi:MAG: iron-sulfur cluster-binding protein [Firmicutes bacterium]|nr:iron-sulfur cluster-binding protein [Bacillota bacterium]